MRINHISFICVLLFMLGINTVAFSSNIFWMDAQKVPSEGIRKIVPEKYRLVTIDELALKNFLLALPNSSDNARIIQLPVADGSMREFKIWNDPIFTPVLQGKFPEINTYTAVAIDDASVTAKIDFTLLGFHAMIFDGVTTFFIDPYSNKSDGFYIAYYKSDYHRTVENYMHCDFDNDNKLPVDIGEPTNINGTLPSNTALRLHGSKRNNYRLALSCTGEYALAVSDGSPTVGNVLSAMTTTINRVNGIYERELAVKFTLIDDEDALIYLNPTTDPFTANNNGSDLLVQNQSNTNSNVSSNKYDIGHIFSTGGGGIAQLASVCNNWVKAMGVTGSENPVGDAYDVDYVAHEMGHQFGAQHTFNSNKGGCNGNNEKEYAYEPGSGSTIMAYAGICGSTDNLQNHSDDYFHASSLLDMSRFITTGFFGGGGSGCGSSSSGGEPPVVDLAEASYAIPYKTPYELEAPNVSGGANNSLKFCWEEWDLGYISSGNPGDLGKPENQASSFTHGPAFRSFNPTSSRLRVFPQISKVIASDFSTTGERISNVARNSKFKLTVRSLNSGWGTFSSPDEIITLNVINTGTPFTVTSPSTPEVWQTSSTQTIAWNVAQTNTAPINCSNVDIFLSEDGGITYPHLVAQGVPNNGSATITVPNSFNSSSVRVKVKGSDNVFFNIAPVNVTVEGTVSVKNVELENGIRIYPNPTSDLLYIDNSTSSKLDVSVYNAIGQKMYESQLKNKATVDTKVWASGLYFVHIYDTDKKAAVVKTISVK